MEAVNVCSGQCTENVSEENLCSDLVSGFLQAFNHCYLRYLPESGCLLYSCDWTPQFSATNAQTRCNQESPSLQLAELLFALSLIGFGHKFKVRLISGSKMFSSILSFLLLPHSLMLSCTWCSWNMYLGISHCLGSSKKTSIQCLNLVILNFLYLQIIFTLTVRNSSNY